LWATAVDRSGTCPPWAPGRTLQAQGPTVSEVQRHRQGFLDARCQSAVKAVDPHSGPRLNVDQARFKKLSEVVAHQGDAYSKLLGQACHRAGPLREGPENLQPYLAREQAQVETDTSAWHFCGGVGSRAVPSRWWLWFIDHQKDSRSYPASRPTLRRI